MEIDDPAPRGTIDNRPLGVYIKYVHIGGYRGMVSVNVTRLRGRLPEYLGRVRKGEEIAVTSHGKVIARIVPDRDVGRAAREALIGLRKKCRIGDVVSPTGAEWESAR
jgi:prevent-host-death family protein